MKLDRSAIDRLLRLDDDGLRTFLRKLGQEAGLDVGGISIDTSDMARLRQVLRTATDEDIGRAAEALREKGILTGRTPWKS